MCTILLNVIDTQNLVPSSLVNRKLYNGDVLGNAVSVKNPYVQSLLYFEYVLFCSTYKT